MYIKKLINWGDLFVWYYIIWLWNDCFHIVLLLTFNIIYFFHTTNKKGCTLVCTVCLFCIRCCTWYTSNYASILFYTTSFEDKSSPTVLFSHSFLLVFHRLLACTNVWQLILITGYYERHFVLDLTRQKPGLNGDFHLRKKRRKTSCTK